MSGHRITEIRWWFKALGMEWKELYEVACRERFTTAYTQESGRFIRGILEFWAGRLWRLPYLSILVAHLRACKIRRKITFEWLTDGALLLSHSRWHFVGCAYARYQVASDLSRKS